MHKYAHKPKEKKSAKVYGRGLRISTKSSVIVCRVINGMPVQKAKKLLGNVVAEKESINGKYYTNVTSEILGLVQSAEKNAEFKGLNTARLFVNASAHKGFTFYTPRRFKLRRRKKKVTNVQVVVEER